MPTRSVGADYDFKGLFALIAAKMDPRSGTPAGLGAADEGRFWYDITTHKFMTWNGTAAIDVTNLTNSTGSLTNSRISDFQAGVFAARLDQLTAPTGAVGLNGQKLTGVADGTANTDVATYGQLLALINNRGFKDPVRVASVGAGIGISGTAPNALDGVSLAQFDRVLLKDQTTTSANGIYIVQTLGTGANGTWIRAADADSSAELPPGAVLSVQEGTVNADKMFMLTTNGPITLGTTSLTFASYGASSGEVGIAGNGLTKTGVTYDVVAGTSGTIVVGADAVDVQTARVPIKRVGVIPTASATVDGCSITVANNVIIFNHGQNNVCPELVIRAGSSPVSGYTAGELVEVGDGTVDANNVRATLPGTTAPAANNWVFMVVA